MSNYNVMDVENFGFDDNVEIQGLLVDGQPVEEVPDLWVASVSLQEYEKDGQTRKFASLLAIPQALKDRLGDDLSGVPMRTMQFSSAVFDRVKAELEGKANFTLSNVKYAYANFKGRYSVRVADWTIAGKRKHSDVTDVKSVTA